MRVPRPALLVPALTAGLLLAGCGSDEEPSQQAAAPSCTYAPTGDAAREAEPPGQDDVVREGTVDATLVTSAGEIPLVLDAAAAPCTVASFTSLARQGFFDDTECHRLTTQGIFVLQCGDPTGTGTGGPGYQFADENTEGAAYPRGTVAMANAGPGTNGSQFFLVYDESPLPPDYSVFGTVGEEGLAVLDRVADAGVRGGAPDGPPATPVQVGEVVLE